VQQSQEITARVSTAKSVFEQANERDGNVPSSAASKEAHWWQQVESRSDLLAVGLVEQDRKLRQVVALQARSQKMNDLAKPLARNNNSTNTNWKRGGSNIARGSAADSNQAERGNKSHTEHLTAVLPSGSVLSPFVEQPALVHERFFGFHLLIRTKAKAVSKQPQEMRHTHRAQAKHDKDKPDAAPAPGNLQTFQQSTNVPNTRIPAAHPSNAKRTRRIWSGCPTAGRLPNSSLLAVPTPANGESGQSRNLRARTKKEPSEQRQGDREERQQRPQRAMLGLRDKRSWTE
jgi:hypothetical protein